MAFDRAGEQIATFSYDSSVKLWSARDGRAIHTLAGHRGWVLGGTFSPDGRTSSRMAVMAGAFWSLRRTPPAHFTHRSAVIDATFSEDGSMILTAAADGTASIYLTQVDQLLKLGESRLPSEPASARS